jgi:hypothetical protein
MVFALLMCADILQAQAEMYLSADCVIKTGYRV